MKILKLPFSTTRPSLKMILNIIKLIVNQGLFILKRETQRKLQNALKLAFLSILNIYLVLSPWGTSCLKLEILKRLLNTINKLLNLTPKKSRLSLVLVMLCMICRSLKKQLSTIKKLFKLMNLQLMSITTLEMHYTLQKIQTWLLNTINRPLT